jgi:hypothetical protein
MNGESTDDGRKPPVGIRKYPYPYAAAASITGDLDDLRTELDFVEMVRFWNTADSTAVGPGLDLELGHSFWFYDATGACEVTVFRGLTNDLSESAPLLERLLRSGHVDCLHTYGDFSRGGFRRELAEEALRYLSDRGLAVEVWVNHGWWRGSPNTQQVGPLPEQLGDDPGTPSYHTDLLIPSGVRFIDRYEIVHTVGQDAPSAPRDRAVQAIEAMRYGLSTGDWRARSIFANRLVEPRTLGDGQGVYSFKRFIGKRRGLEAAGGPELAVALAGPVLDELRAKGGSMLVYTHPWRSPGSSLVSPEAASALRGLAREHHEGRILVTTTRKLLRYNVAWRWLDWTVRTDRGPLDVVIRDIDDPVTGRRAPSPGELEGITFYTPEPTRTRVILPDGSTPTLDRNPPDQSGVASVTIPWKRLGPPPLE